jgi:hypothetical protein
MPYRIETNNPECASGYAVVKESDGSLIFCHKSRREAKAQIAAIEANENYRALPRNYRPASSQDVPDGRQCSNCTYYAAGYCNRWDAKVIASYYCNAWAGSSERADAPAPKEDQIEGSDKNEPGSASGKAGEIDLNEATVKALETKAENHNAEMTKRDRPNWTRVRVPTLKAVYRRGSGAYSVSHRPGISRPAWSMARVNAFIYLSRTGRPQNPRYVGDNDLLNPDHPRYSEKKDDKQRQESYTPTKEMRAEARRGLEWRRIYGRGGTEIGVARARDIINGALSYDTVLRMRSFFARHEVDKQGKGFTPDEDCYPSAGRIAWALWGGDPGKTWADNIVKNAAD